MGKKKSDDIFYGLILNEDQEKFKEALMDDNIQVVLCDATAGSGKTLLSVACAKIKVLGEQKYDSAIWSFRFVRRVKSDTALEILHKSSQTTKNLFTMPWLWLGISRVEQSPMTLLLRTVRPG